MCILFYITWAYFIVKRKNTRAHRLFSTMIIISDVYMIFDMLTVYMINHIDDFPFRLNHFAHVIFMSAMCAFLYTVYMYIRALAYKNAPFRYREIIPLAVAILGSIFLKFDYVETEYGNYSWGPYAFVVFASGYLYYFAGMYILIRHHKEMDVKSFRAIIMAMLFQVTAVILQGIFPTLLISGIGITVIVVSLFYSVESPDAVLIEMLADERAKADSANRAKSQFLAHMSHEIRTPINAVLGMNEMILRESGIVRESVKAEDETIREAVDNITVYSGNIQSAGANLLSIINDILDISKIEEGKMEIMDEPYNAGSLLNDVCNMVFFRAREKGLDFSVDVDEALPGELRGDEVRMRQVITNLLSNAVKYTEKGDVRLSVSGSIKENEKKERILDLMIVVKDTGIGIKPEDMDRLFDKFQRLDPGQTSTVEGTGLGLAITHELLTMMGGSITVESRYGEGSVFSVRIPQKIVSTEPVGDFKQRFEESILASDKNRETFHAEDASILIVDDTSMNLMVAAGLLEDTKMRIDTALSGEEALELADETKYDIILLDQRMPGMDGVETLHCLRERVGGPNRETPVICLTADAISGAKERFISEGFTDYLAKPIDSAALKKMIMKYLPFKKISLVMPDDLEEENVSVKEENVSDKEESAAPFDVLKKAGIDPDSGMKYCQKNESLYRALLSEYAKGSAKTLENMRRYIDAKDWKNYGILVHSLKNTSRTIGAVELSEAALRMEKAADETNEDMISNEHPLLVEEYKKTVDAALAVAAEGGEGSSIDDDEIMEFVPKK